MKTIIAFLYNVKLFIALWAHPRQIVMIFSLFLLSSLSSGFELPISGPVVQNVKTTEPFQQDGWILSSQKNGIKVFYKIEYCTGSKRILLKINNSNATEEIVDLECRIKSGLNDIVIPSTKNTVPANTVLEGTCANSPAQSTFIAIPEKMGYSEILITIK